MDGRSVTSIILQALYMTGRERSIMGIEIINGERRANVCWRGVIYKIHGSTVVINYQ